MADHLISIDQELSTREGVKMRVLKDELKRLLIIWQIYKHALDAIRTSDTIKSWAEEAKKNKNKDFVDFRVLAAEQLNFMNGMLFKMKKTMRPETFNSIMSTLTSEQVREIDLLLDELTELREDVIERITYQVKEAKVKAGIPLNNPDEQLIVEPLKIESNERVT